MGTASTTKFIKNSTGNLAEESALTTSAGAGDAHKIVALNAAGILDASITNAKNTSAGAGDAGKLPALNASGILDATIVNSKSSSAGAGDAGKLPALNASGVLDDSIVNASVASAANKLVKTGGDGKIDVTMMPVGFGDDAASIIASEALTAGDLVNIWNNVSVANVRKADGSTSGKEANGFVLTAVSASAAATVYFEGTNTQCTGLTPGPQFLSGTTAGKTVAVAPTGTGKVVQRVGFAVSATAMNFDSSTPILLA